MSSDYEYRIRNVTAVLGPTNTGKTHLAIERMLGHETGMIGLPLRLLAREVYDRIVAKVGPEKVALITGEEKIKPETARYWVCTVEAMPPDIQTDFLAIDEIQLCADPERGHVFTDRLLNARGKQETLMLGASTMREAIAELIPDANFITRPRLSKLTYAGEKKITRLPPRSAVVTFSANDVYAIAELMRRQRGGAAVVIGALSPRTRNAQVALYQSGEVDFLIATDAIGMGLNLDVDHVALAQTRKFDGMSHRELNPSELAQIAGRAGRHMKDGTFGVTGGIDAFQPDLVERLENHQFESIRTLQWRARSLDFSSVAALRESLRQLPREARLQRARAADDLMALETLSNDSEIMDRAKSRANVELLWDVCQVPDYRKISTQNHADMVSVLYKSLTAGDRRIPEDWIAMQVAVCDKTEGDIDTLSQRLAHIRTWTYVANRADWLQDATGWQEKTRAVEDKLSDALHEQLTQRFVDRRASALMRGMRDKDDMFAEIADDGAVHVEKHFVGRLKGFTFQPETQADDAQGKAARGAAAHVLAKELDMRARRVASAKKDAFKLNRQGEIIWRNDPIARLSKGDALLKPLVALIADEHLSGPDREKVQERLNTWVSETIAERLEPLVKISAAEDVSGLARGIAFRMTETFGVLRRETAADELKSLDQAARQSLRKYGVRFGAFNVFFPVMLKPASAELALILRAINGTADGLALDKLPEAPKPGLTSIPVQDGVPGSYYTTLGFQVCGPRAVRIDMLERLADMIRPLLAFRADQAKPGTKTPAGSTGDGGFVAMPVMMSIMGCSSAELGAVLTSLGFSSQKKPTKSAIRHAPPAPVVVEPVAVADAVPAEAPVTDVVVAVPEDGALEAIDAPAPTGEDAVSDALEAQSEVLTVAALTEPAVAETPAVEAAVVETPIEAATADAAPVEEPMTEVWRPRRKHQHHERRRGDGQRPAGDGEARRDGRGDRRGFQRNGPRGDRRPGDHKPGDGTPIAAATGDGAAATPAGAAGATAPAQQPPGDRPWRRNGEKRDDNRRDGEKRFGDRRDGPREGQRDGPKRDGDRPKRDFGDRKGGRDFGDRRGGAGGRGGERTPPPTFSASPQKSTRGPDPDSPFAKLMALKAAMEKKD
jgi:ATP-dependent RNA helicase SUPV3L1/SUV3